MLKIFQKVRKKTKKEILQLYSDLLEFSYSKERIIAFDWAFRLSKLYIESDFQLLETWLKKYGHSWGACDDLCTHAFGAFVFQFREFIQKIREWTISPSRWIRRAGAVAAIYSIRKRHLGALSEFS
jgi:3-methyladenine DNA glycosylase AlkD